MKEKEGNEIIEIRAVNIDKVIGRELDKLVHLCVFEGEYASKEIPYYSTSIVDAMPVLEWLINRGDVFIEWWQDREWYICNRDLYVRHKHPEFGWEAMSDKVEENEKPSLPLAICRAALKEYNRAK